VTSVTAIIAVKVSNIPIRNQEGIMSLLYHTSEKADLKRPDYSFILASLVERLFTHRVLQRWQMSAFGTKRT
jgi:hypothetical protein